MRNVSRRFLINLLAFVAFGPMLVPLAIMVVTALTETGGPSQSTSIPFLGMELGNFATAWEQTDLVRAAANTGLLVVLNVSAAVLVSPIVAYGLTKVSWAGSRWLMLAGLSVIALPFQVVMLPLYFVWDRLGLVGTFLPLVLPPFFGSVFFIFLARQFMLDIPSELSEAAILDGASHFQTFVFVMLPLLRPLLAVIATLQFTWTWIDFLGPLIYLRSPENFTLAISLFSFFGQNGTAWGPLMAACVLFAMPAVLVFLVAQRYFVQLDLSSGIK